MQSAIGFSLPRDFVKKIDRVAASVGLSRSSLIFQVIRRRVAFNNDAPLAILPSTQKFRTGRRRVVGFRCSESFRNDILAAADRLDMDYSLFIFYCLRAYLLEGSTKHKPGKRK